MTYKALPESGGLLDQPAGLLEKMTAAYNAWMAFKSFRERDSSKTSQWIEANPDLNDIRIRINRIKDHAGI